MLSTDGSTRPRDHAASSTVIGEAASQLSGGIWCKLHFYCGKRGILGYFFGARCFKCAAAQIKHLADDLCNSTSETVSSRKQLKSIFPARRIIPRFKSLRFNFGSKRCGFRELWVPRSSQKSCISMQIGFSISATKTDYDFFCVNIFISDTKKS
ncbi:MAG: hypothetical protein ACRYGK_18990 [Janthinobacterium lividum]